MVSRICHLCNAYYTDEEGHDYNECVATLEIRLEKAGTFLGDVQMALNAAIVARNRRHEQHSYCDADITRLGSHIEQARKNLTELEYIAAKTVESLPSGISYSRETSKWVLKSRLEGIREAIQAFEDAAKVKRVTDCFCDGLPECNCK